MDIFIIVTGVISTIGVIYGIYHYMKPKTPSRNNTENTSNVKVKGDKNEVIVNQNIIQNSQNSKKDISTTHEDKRRVSVESIGLKSDHDIRNYINKEMENMPLIEADYDKLAGKFIGCNVNWDITVDSIETHKAGLVKVMFYSSAYSRVEQFLVNIEKFPVIKFAKKDSKFRIKAKIKSLEINYILLDDVVELESI